jgi:hypothetical protein
MTFGIAYQEKAMKHRIIVQLSLVIFCLIALLVTGRSEAETLTIESADGHPGDTLILPVTIDIPVNTAAAVFTLTYNTQYLTLTDIQSSFFETFFNQWNALTPQPVPLPPDQVTVDGTVYTQPIESRTISGSTFIAAARAQTNSITTTVFTLSFTLHADIPDGSYPISISPTQINNTAYGYAGSGETVPILLGADEGQTDLSLAYPVINTSVVNGTISVNTSMNDVDGDGIDDAWELTYVTDLDILGAPGHDEDHDGYSDLQEYLNWLAGDNDQAGNPYNPIVPNAPGGTGYTKPGVHALPAIYLLLFK